MDKPVLVHGRVPTHIEGQADTVDSVKANQADTADGVKASQVAAGRDVLQIVGRRRRHN